MNRSLVIPLLAILGIKLIGTALFLLYFSQIFSTPLQEIHSSNNQERKDCQTSWEFFGGKCYFFSAQENTWDSSRKDCAQSNADLAVVNSKEELNFLMSRTENANYFVGLTSRPSRGRWTWIDNTKLDQSIFNIQHRDYDCAVVGILSTSSVSCSVPNRWICETNT